MTNEEVAALLGTTIEEIEELGDELGVPDDQWAPDDVFEADQLLDDDAEDED